MRPTEEERIQSVGSFEDSEEYNEGIPHIEWCALTGATYEVPRHGIDDRDFIYRFHAGAIRTGTDPVEHYSHVSYTAASGTTTRGTTTRNPFSIDFNADVGAATAGDGYHGCFAVSG